jgi:membrane protein
MRRDRVSLAAGAFAYRWFLALFPVVVALLALAALVSVSRSGAATLVRGVTEALPAGAASVFDQAITHADGNKKGALSTIVVAAAVALWSATSAMAMLEEALDMAYELPLDRSFVRKRIIALPLLGATLVLGGAASALVVFGPQLGRAIRQAAPVQGMVFADGWTALRWVVALALMAFLLSVLYNLAPNQARSCWQWVSPGALLGTSIWAVTSLGFSLYTSSFGSYDRTYGAFAGVAILIFWLYLTGLAILLGGELNAAFEREGATPQKNER